MNSTTQFKRERNEHLNDRPMVIVHESFGRKRAEGVYNVELDAESAIKKTGYLPDDLTKACSRAMHYASYRMNRAKSKADRRYWRDRYYGYRDQIILGNQKLIFRAIEKFSYLKNYSEDMMGECYLVMIHAVAAFNPWLGIRFSTYAFTCLMRALARLSRKLISTDQKTAPLNFDLESDVTFEEEAMSEPANAQWNRIAHYLTSDDDVLSEREKTVLRKRFSFDGRANTLKEVGQQLGLSKERVRQIQVGAMGKIREVIGVQSTNPQ